MDKPNIILINCDDLGYGDLGCYGSTLNRTPHIDKLAAEGMRFTDFYAASPVCSASRGGMLTGCYPPRVGFGKFENNNVLFPGQGLGMNRDEETMATMLKNAGYSTALVGKWHCGDQPEFLPTRHGFDKYFGLPYSNDMGRQISEVNWLAPPLPLIDGEEVVQQQPDLAALTERFTCESIEFMRQNRDKPFFLYLAHIYTHLPHYAPTRFMNNSENGEFGGVMSCLDWSTGAIMHELKALGIDDNTLVIFTSDNGGKGTHGGTNWPLRSKKGTTWEGGLRVPCIARWPGRIQSGAVNSELSCALDFFATFAALAGTAPSGKHAIDSLDVSGFIGGATLVNPREVFFYYNALALEAVRKGDWKLKTRAGGKDVKLLFNVKEDIGEDVNLYSENSEIVAELEALMAACREDLGDGSRGLKGKNVRPAGRVANPVPLTEYDPNHPYIMAMYDKGERG